MSCLMLHSNVSILAYFIKRPIWTHDGASSKFVPSWSRKWITVRGEGFKEQALYV
jgi:hypothetical protein